MPMKDSLEEFLELKRDLERKQREADKNAGAVEQLRSELETEFQCDSVQAGKKLVKRWAKELERDEKELGDGINECQQVMEREAASSSTQSLAG